MNNFRLLEQAKDALRHNRDGIVSSFQRRFIEFTDPAASTEALARNAESQLSLMSDHDLHDTAANDVVAQTIMTVCDIEIRGLTRRFKELASSEGPKTPVNPIAPDLIGRAVLVALRERDVSLTLRRLLAPMIAAHLADNVRVLYQDILDFFAGKGVFATEKTAQELAPQDGMGGTGATRSDETVMQRPLAAAPAPGQAMPPTKGRAIAAALLALTRLQQGKIQLSAPTAPDTAEVLHRLAEAKFIGDLGNSGLLTLNMVTALFEAILGDKRIGSAIKTEVARLQVPTFKVALLDPAFLKQQDHPVRQLLNALADAGRNAHQVSDRAAFEQSLTTLANRIVADFTEDLDLFDEAGKAFLQQLSALRQPVTQNQAASQACQPQLDKVAFRKQIKTEAQDSNLPPSVLAFLFEQWETLHRAVYTQPEQADPALADPSKVMSTLIRTLDPGNWHDSRATMLTLLPGVLKRLKLGLQAAHVAQANQDKFLAGLAKCHAVVMQAAREKATASAEAAPAPASAPAQEATAAAKPAAETPDQIAKAPGPRQAQADRYDALVRTLQRGALIEFRDQGGSMSWLKLAWISPNGGIFVFTNKQGERALTINAGALAERFRQEQARIAIDSTVREDSPSQMIGGIQRVA
jgi:hypothetical protein